VVSPHPVDERIMASGVIFLALKIRGRSNHLTRRWQEWTKVSPKDYYH
jgi:hypothetical protein